MYLIVGIDPGKTSALACLDLNGRLIFKEHKTFGGLGWFISTLNRIGTPVIIACDKAEPSTIVKKINTAFNSKLFSPESDYSIDGKRAAAKSMGIKDPHERDAYIAAISAYNAYVNKFKQAEHVAQESNYKNIDELKAKVVGKYSIKEAMLDKKANRK